MSNPEFDDPITWDELVWALDNVRFPELGSSGYKTLPEATGDSAQHAAAQLFRNVAARKAEAARWTVGALYADGFPGPHPRVYLRAEGGWLAIGSQARIADGELSTSGFKLLTPTDPAGPLIQQAPSPALFADLAVLAVRQTQTGTTPPPLGSQGPELRAHNHEDDGTVEGCRGCFPATGPGLDWSSPSFPGAVRATEADH